MISSLIASLFVLVFGTLYPAYCSYKAVKSKNVREYVKWMMYWIVFALFTSAETFADIFIFWLPFYYEVKVIFVIWLLSPYTNGSSFLYRKFVHPTLVKKEPEIDDMISKAKEQGYSAVLTLGAKGISYATDLALHAATRGPFMLDQFRRSFSTSDVTITEITDDEDPPRYDNDMALVQARRRNIPRQTSQHEAEEETNPREDDSYRTDREAEFRRAAASRQPRKPGTRRPLRELSSERKQRLETWDEDAMEAESIPSPNYPSPTYPSSPLSTSPNSASPGSPYDPRRQQRQQQQRLPGDELHPLDPERFYGIAQDDDDDDDDLRARRYADRKERYANPDRAAEAERFAERYLERYADIGKEGVVMKPHPPTTAAGRSAKEMSIDERLAELEGLDPSLSNNLPPSSLARINRHYLSGLRKEEPKKSRTRRK